MADRIVRALVTGASSGLGESFARQLAARGVQLVLVARDGDRLRALADELPVDVEVLVADLVRHDHLREVEARLAAIERPVDLLVNNAGSGAYGAVWELSADEQVHLVDLNITALLRLTRAVLPQLLEREVGGVIQVGSIVAYQPDPYVATYGATKAFVRSFTEALHVELADTAVHTMLLSPGSVPTRFADRAGIVGEPVPDVVRTDADGVVTAALDSFARREPVCLPGGANKAMIYAGQVTPSAISRRVSGLVHRRFSGRP